MATPPFVDPSTQGGPPAGTGPGGSDWLTQLIQGGLGLLQPQPVQPGSGPGNGSVAPWVGNLVGGAYGTPTDFQAGGSNAINPALATADLTASQQLQGGYGNAINNWDTTLGAQTQNQLPFLQTGQNSIGQIMQGLSNGTFGAGSLAPVPTAPGTFSAPTLEQAQQQPGYQFTLQQGNKGILQGAAAAGGAISGGTLKALGQFNQNAATTNYQNVFNNALQGYGANLQQYGAQLSGYNTGLNAQQQEFSQLFAPAQLGQTSANNLNANLGTGALNIGQLMSAIGSAQAAGTLGATKDYLSGSDLLKALQQKLAGAGAPGSGGPGGGVSQAPPQQIGGWPGIQPTPIPSPNPVTLDPTGGANSTVTYPPAEQGSGGGGGGGGGPDDPGAAGGTSGGPIYQDPNLGDNALTIGRMMQAARARRAAFAAPG